jgi:hypothetical protein
MQTFLPYDNYEKTAQCLDYRRLGKQRVEAWQILQTLLGKSHGWKNHPAVKMWRGYEKALILYGMQMCMEWKKRGYVDNMEKRFRKEWFKLESKKTKVPLWFGDRAFHLSHKSNLLRKDRRYYGPIFGKIRSDRPYIWPV